MEVNPNLSDTARYDYEVVQKAIAGDNAAYAELLERYRDTIYFMLLKKVNNEIDAEDLTIEAFGKAFKSLEKYNPTYAFSTWLFKIANNNCVDFLRKQKHKHYSMDSRMQDDDDSDASYDIASDLLDPEERLIKNQKADLLKDVVRQLKSRYSQLIRLRYYKEMSYQEISEEMKIPLGTVKAQLYRSRELLRSMLKTDAKNM